jgi:hypothetical protein
LKEAGVEKSFKPKCRDCRHWNRYTKEARRYYVGQCIRKSGRPMHGLTGAANCSRFERRCEKQG